MEVGVLVLHYWLSHPVEGGLVALQENPRTDLNSNPKEGRDILYAVLESVLHLSKN